MWTIKRPIIGRGLGHMTKFRNFGTTLITVERIEQAIRFKSGTDIKETPLLRVDHKIQCDQSVTQSAGPLNRLLAITNKKLNI